MKKIKTLIKPFLKKKIPDIRPGDTVRVSQKIKETGKEGKTKKGQELKERTQTFEGVVIARKHGQEAGATITVRKVISGVGVERIFPLHLPTIEKIEITKRGKTRRAKLYYLRTAKGKKAKLRRVELTEKVGLGDKVVVKIEKEKEFKKSEPEK